MSKWDWIHAGLEVATFSQALQAKNDLSDLKTSSEMEQVRQALLELFRNYVFEISRDIKLAEEQISDYPQQVYIVAKSLEMRLIQSGLSAEFFPQFQDKEYVLETERKVTDVINKSRKELTSDQIEESELAIKYIAEMPLLQDAITAMTAKEKIIQTDEEWKGLKSVKSKNNSSAIRGIVGVFVMASIGLPLGVFGISFLFGGSGGENFGGLIMLAISGAMLYWTVNNFKKSGNLGPRYRELETIRKNLSKDLMSKEKWEQVIEKFGDLNSGKFTEIYKERTSFLNPLIGEDNQTELYNRSI